MRILVVSQHYWPENFRITDICKGLTDDGIAVDVLCGIPNYPKGEWFDGYAYSGPRRQRHEGSEIFRAGEVRRKNNTSLRIFLNFIAWPVTALFSLPRLHGRRYDVVFSYETSPVFMMLPAIVYAKLHRVPLVTYVLDLWPENLYSAFAVNNRFLRRILRGVSHWFYRRSDKLIAMSPALAQRLGAIAPKAEIHVIPQYCEDFYTQDIHDSALQARFAGRCNILFAGNISPVQNLTILVEVAKRLRAGGNTQIHFVIVGDGMSRAALEEAIDTAGVRPYFTFEGQHPVTDIPAYHTMADALFASLSDSEDVGLTIPAKITSYMAAGRPCLVAISGEASRVIREAGCGFVCGAGEIDALHENILRLAAMTPEQRADMGARARAYFNRHFRRSLLLAQLEDVLGKPRAQE